MASSFSDGCDSPAIAHDPPSLAVLRGYWEALRGAGGLPPMRSAIDPRGIEGALDCTFIADRVAPGVARFRLAGAGIADLMGMDVRGMPLLTLLTPPARPRFATALETAMTSPAILDLWLEAERGIGRPALSGRMLMLPLRRTDGSGGLAIGCLALDGRTGRAPRRFAIARERIRLPDGDLPRTTSSPQPRAPVPGMAEAGTTFTAGPRPYLRLVTTGRATD